MTIETLKRANQLKEKINDYKEAITSIGKYDNTSLRCQIDGIHEPYYKNLMYLDKETKDYLIDYFESKLKELESEFENL